MSIKNVKVRFNLSKENDRKAYEHLQNAEVSYSKAVISAICGYMELFEIKESEDAFLERVIITIISSSYTRFILETKSIPYVFSIKRKHFFQHGLSTGDGIHLHDENICHIFIPFFHDRAVGLSFGGEIYAFFALVIAK